MQATRIAQQLSISSKSVLATIQLLDEGSTIPFIARYRKEATGSLDEVQLAAIRDLLQSLRELDKRREVVIRTIEEQGKLTPTLHSKLLEAENMSILEDLYLPYKPKRKTRASVARERGLAPLAELLMEQKAINVEALAKDFVSLEKGVDSMEGALAGARDIIAEQIAEDAQVRAKTRALILDKGVFKSRVVEEKRDAASNYKDYFEWSEPLKNVPSHRVLAMRRGEKEGFLLLDITIEEDLLLPVLDHYLVKGTSAAAGQIRMALLDSYKRLLLPSMETEMRLWSRQKADEEAISVFADNARQLLLAAPMGQKTIMAIDPGFRTGCKVVCLDAQGQFLEYQTVFLHQSEAKKTEGTALIQQLVQKYSIEVIAIGNGTAGRETESLVRGLAIPEVQVVMVNESGASIYSASATAREEFPDQDVTVRGAISIGRRLMDPLAELVKIDPKSIGVGQYQHDVDQNKLQAALDDTVVSCVNSVGVELNTASQHLLAYVSGLGPSIAKQIIQFRQLNGPFKNRLQLKKVPRLGDKAFEQSAGFLRIQGGEHPLDASAVHPERYPLVEQMAKDLDCQVGDLIKNKELRQQIKLENYISKNIGMPTLQDILVELAKPGRDPRAQFEAVEFTEGVHAITDLQVGMTLTGIVTNITNFGAFVDIGVHQDGLVHVSHLADQFVSDPKEVVQVQQKVQVRVIEVDAARKRIGLSMKGQADKVATASKKTKVTPKNQSFLKNKSKNRPIPPNAGQKKEKQVDMQEMLKALQTKFKGS
jgi:uncharacterized protein